MKRKRWAVVTGAALAVGLTTAAVLTLTHRPAGAPSGGEPDGGPASTDVSTTVPPEEAPPFDQSALGVLTPTGDDLAGRYSAGKFRNVSASALRLVDGATIGTDVTGLVGGVERSYRAYNSYYQSDTTAVFRVLQFGSRADATAFVTRYDKPARVDNTTTRDTVAVSTFEYAQPGKYVSAAESMAATGFIVVWVTIADSDELSIYTGVAYLMVEDAVVAAIDSLPALAGPA